MKTVSMQEFRREFPKILRWLLADKEVIRLTYRGKPVADLRPVASKRTRPPKDDPFYRICEMAVDGGDLSNADFDHVVYSSPRQVR